jgi:sodium bicarbonate transporter 10
LERDSKVDSILIKQNYDKKKNFIFRWVKFEEDVESGGRWSKPHVATLSLHSLLELRNCIFNGSILLDMQADQLPIIIGLFDFLLFLNVTFFFFLKI